MSHVLGWVREIKENLSAAIRYEVELQRLRFSFRDENENRITMSKFAPPTGSDYSFTDNDVRVSCLTGLHFRHSVFAGNRLHAAQILGMDLNHSRVQTNRIYGSTLEGLVLQGQSSLSEVQINGSRMIHLDLTDGSFFATTRIDGSNLEKVIIRGNSHIEGCRLNGMALLSSEFDQVKLTNSKLMGVNIADAQWSNVEMTNCRFRNCRFMGSQISQVNVRDLKVSNVDFSGMTINSTEEFMEVFMGARQFNFGQN